MVKNKKEKHNNPNHKEGRREERKQEKEERMSRRREREKVEYGGLVFSTPQFRIIDLLYFFNYR